jgi:hypothetical protein
MFVKGKERVGNMDFRFLGRLCLLAALSLGLAGCGSSGPSRYELSGAVTYGGNPVPAGYLVFAPDTNNSGPGSQATIQDGRYRTMAGQGTIGGPHLVTISGFDGQAFDDGPVKNPMGKPLFKTFQVKVDLPKNAATQDFDVPRQGTR